MTSPYHISTLLDKMMSIDKDFRFMATNDLMVELQKDSIKLDDDSERKVVQSILKLVEDKNGEVQNLAVKCLAPLVRKIRDPHIETIVNTLATNMFSDSERLRDISSVGLKTVIGELSHLSTQVTASVSRTITRKLLTAFKNPSVSPYVMLETLDILVDLIHNYGTILSEFHESLLSTLCSLLVDPNPLSVRKRAYIALCYLAVCCQPKLFEELITRLLEGLAQGQNAQQNFSVNNTKTYIQAIGAVSRQAGQRVSSHLDTIIPLIMYYARSQVDDELRESCQQVFEILAICCFREVTPYIPEIVKLSLELLSYDPNYNYESDDDDEGMDTDELEQDELEEDDEYEDDDDVSWKVRRASAKCLAAILGSRPELLTTFYQDVSPVLVTQFKEREENVKADIFAAYQALLHRTKLSFVEQSLDPSDMETTASPQALLLAQTPTIVKALHKQLKDKSTKTRQGCFVLLTDLVSVAPGALANHCGAIIPGTLVSLTDKTISSNVKIDSLMFLNVLLTSHRPEVFHPYINAIVPAVLSAVDDPFYKIASEGLVVLNNLIQILCPLDDAAKPYDYQQYVDPIYKSTLRRLKATDIDQEVKERAITCMGQVISCMGDQLSSELPSCLPIFLDRLKNEITRLTTVRVITQIARSPLKIDLSVILSDTLSLLATFLRKNHRDLRLASVISCTQLFKVYAQVITASLMQEVVQELPVLITENDLHVSQLVLQFLSSMMETCPADAVKNMLDMLMPNIIKLVLSSLLQGSSLAAAMDFFQKLVTMKIMAHEQVFELLTSAVYSPTPLSTQQQSSSSTNFVIHRQAFRSIAKCLSVTCSDAPDFQQKLVSRFVADVQNVETSDSVKLLALLSIGEIGQQSDLSGFGNLQQVIIDVFSSPTEEVRSAASFALGNICAGNLSKYIPFIMSEIQKNPRRQYLLLHSLKEIITCRYRGEGLMHALQPYVDDIWSVLFQHFESPEEGTRNVVAECVGKLTLLEPQTLLPRLQENLKSPSANVRGTVVTAFKYTISDQPQPIDHLLRSCITDFMEILSDPELSVRHVALVALNSAAHNKPSLIRDLLDTILPKLYTETKIRKELIHEVEMGPFKHPVDDGLDLRKVAFECMYTLMETCLDRLDVFEFLSHVEDGLKDHYDIKMLTYLLLMRLSKLRANALLQRMDKLIEPLKATIYAKVKANSVKQEYEKQEELKRSALRAVSALSCIPDSDKSPQLLEFVNLIKSSTETSELFESIQNDVTSPAPTSSAEHMELS
ncbi:cullin-associated NEDD8-dissociated protein 1-like [Dysidea avara]|uniref:cullin-associated NEDD8-dissociated protein 1-like n=1 Tax=Dysidea avara TaxID=196820 RepID=UPI00332CA46E